MRRIVFLPLFALTLLFLSCDGQAPTEPSIPEASLDVTAAGPVTNTFQLKGTCAKGYSGAIRYIVGPGGATNSVYCPGGTNTVSAAGVQTFKVDFFAFDPPLPVDCGQLLYRVLDGDIPVRTKCTVNGRDASGKPIAKLEIKYVK